jgi:transposase
VLTLGFYGRIIVSVEPLDGRKEIDSLAGVVRSVLLGDPLSCNVFVFKNKSRDKHKILARMGDGFAIYRHQLERGIFAFSHVTDVGIVVTPTQLAMILGSLDPANARQWRRYKIRRESRCPDSGVVFNPACCQTMTWMVFVRS